MLLTSSDLTRIAQLAQLELPSDVAPHVLEQLNGIFDLVQKMTVIDTTGIEPLSHPLAAMMPTLALRLREDGIAETDQRDANQACAPATQDGLYLVPKVIE